MGILFSRNLKNRYVFVGVYLRQHFERLVWAHMYGLGLGWCLTPLSIIFQLNRGGQF
jgi:hypothetical protein